MAWSRPGHACGELEGGAGSGAGCVGVEQVLSQRTTSRVPIDAGNRVTSGITETNYTDCGNVYNRYYAVTAVNEDGESAPSNEDRASEPCGSANAMALPVLSATALTERGGDPVVTTTLFGGKRACALTKNPSCTIMGSGHCTRAKGLHAEDSDE